MKKMMIAAVAAGISLFASAGNVQWGYWGEAESYNGNEFTSGTGLLLVLTGEDALPLFADGAWNMNGATIVATSSYDGDFMGWGVGEFTETPGVNPGTTWGADQQYMAILLTDKEGVTSLEGYEGYYAIALSGRGDQDVVDPTAPTYGTIFETYDTTVAASSWQLAQGSSDVPEPTSGLLLLVGMAGLALKRKKA